MVKKSLVKQAPVYSEYRAFLHANNKPKILKNVNHYLKQYSFFKALASAMPCSVFLLDYSIQEYLFVSEGTEAITGYTSCEVMSMGQKKYVNTVFDKEDLRIFSEKIFSQFIKSAVQLPNNEIKNCRFSVNYRVNRKDGALIKVLQQAVVLETNEEGYPLLILGIITDITSHKSDNKMVFSVSHYTPKSGFKTISSDSFSPEENILSKREKEIVKHIAYGHNTNKIAEILFISPFTVRAHRRNILEKTNCKNVAELISYAINYSIA